MEMSETHRLRMDGATTMEHAGQKGENRNLVNAVFARIVYV